jgi:L-2-hydroxyglutarate oxidase LhgO
VDPHELCLSLAAEFEREGGTLLLHNTLESIERCAAGFRVSARAAGDSAASVESAAVVNAAGLAADAVAALAGIDVVAADYRQHPCKGDYFALAPSAPMRFTGLVYPVHGSAGLGVHVTLDLAGRVRFGPDAHYVDAIDYAIDPHKAAQFAAAAGRYLPGLRAEWLSPDQSGIRPKLQPPGGGFRDFVIAEESARGMPGLVDLLGIESPGLTSALAIAERVVVLLASL